MSLEIRYLKSRPICKVTFRLPAEAAPAAESVHLVGDFNDWNTASCPMTRLKDGVFKIALDLETGRSYRFRYLIDGKTWENDWEAHRYEPAPVGDVENSVVEV